MRAEPRSLALALGLLLWQGAWVRVASASGGTPEAWLNGTQSWDTTPWQEVDMELRGAGGDGLPAGGLGLQWGVVDTFQLSADWQQPFGGGPGASELRAQWREPEYPTWRPAFALLARAGYDGTAWAPRAGLLAALEPFDSSLCATVSAGGERPWGLQAGFWTPYVVSMLRLGVEAEWSDGRCLSASPQLLVNAPGDISLGLGARLDAAGALPPRYLLRLSYQLFSSP